jgi:Mg-chelatase subunit ChlD
MRNLLISILSLLALGAPIAAGAGDDASTASVGLRIEIHTPGDDFVAANGESTVEVEGVASTIGGVRYIDMIFVMDTSSSLRSTDPSDYRSAGAIGLVENLSPRSDIQIGVVSFDSSGELVQPMTSDRAAVIESLQNMPRSGSTNLAAGILKALDELRLNGRPDSSRVIMLFTDGQSNRSKAHQAAVAAHRAGVAIQTLLLGQSKTGAEILDEISWATGGSLVQVSDPAMLPEAFLNLRTTGVDSVTLSVNGSEPVPARLAGGTFIGSLPLETGENRIVATATSLGGQTQESVVTVTLRDASCAALEVAATRSGRPVVSLNDRAVEIVVDASRSMWGRMDGRPKMVVAKDTLQEVSHWFPEDLSLALRAYGSASPSESNDCADSALLVPFGEQNREPIRAAIANLRPLGQTPIAYALNQAARDFGNLDDDLGVVLVSDGIESCGGNPVQAARDLREQGITVHVIGFGLGATGGGDAAGLQAIADASGGRYVTAGSAEELRAALAETVATSFSVLRGNTVVASGSLGTEETVYLPEGDYRVELHSSPPEIVPVSLVPSTRVRLTLEKQGDTVAHVERRDSIEYRSCEAVAANIERLEAGQESGGPLQTAAREPVRGQ